MTSLGDNAYVGTLHANLLDVKNPTGNPHKITGDLEITGDTTCDGGLTAKTGVVRIENKSGSDQSQVVLRCPTQQWDLLGDESADKISIGSFKDSQGVGVSIFSIQDIAGAYTTNIESNPLRLNSDTGASVGAGVASTHTLLIRINNTDYKMLLATP